MRVLVLGAYGLIGAEIALACRARGWEVRGLGRDPDQMRRGMDWVRADLASMTRPEDWAEALADTDVVINAAGALQDGPSGKIRAVHVDAIRALAIAAEAAGVTRIVQISAAGARMDASTAFMATKAEGDSALMGEPVPCVVLRPGLVLGRSVYGGSALLRMLAAVPIVQPIAFADARIRICAMEDLALAALAAAEGRIESDVPLDLVSDNAVGLLGLVRANREWLGFAPARLTVRVPDALARLIGRIADALGWLGWRSPLRTSALTALSEDITGDPEPWRQAGGDPISDLDTHLARQPSTLQDRWHARLSLVMPALVAGLAFFWLVSGLIGIVWRGDAVAILTERGFAPGPAMASVLGGAAADIALGALVLWRSWAKTACLGMIVLSLGYLAAGTIWTPDIWADPLGPFVKVLPSILAAWTLHSILESRRWTVN